MPVWSSPRTWGCFRQFSKGDLLEAVFPTHVGVFLQICRDMGAFSCLPHARGGVSACIALADVLVGSSPRTWGCFYHVRAVNHRWQVFPTHVGVFPSQGRADGKAHGLPHARGGVSRLLSPPGRAIKSSPRTWGCFCLCGR